MVTLACFWAFPLTTLAVSYSPHNVTENTVMTIDTGNPGVYEFAIFREDGSYEGNSAEYHSGLTWEGIYDQVPVGTWHALLTGLMGSCSGETYAECLTNPSYLGVDISLQVTSAASGISTGGGTLAYRPEVSILSPQGQNSFSTEVPVHYQATDKNDAMYAVGEHPFGLSSTPVSIYYSDSIMEWNNTIVASDDKILITKGEPAQGIYTWKIKNILPGNLYRIVVEAVDKTGEVGNAVSDFFNIDLSPPTFMVRANPPVAQKGKVVLAVAPSEELQKPPRVTVAQRGGEDVAVSMEARGDGFEGAYEVLPGFDGTARVLVSGIDRAGNRGTLVLSGGSFNVGVEPPPPPTIVFPVNNMMLATDEISVSGTTREDTEILLTVNGERTYTATPGPDESFIIHNVQLNKTLPRGENILHIVARDQAGAMGEADILRVSLNVRPTITLLEPPEGKSLSGISVFFSSRIEDENNDPVLLRYEALPLFAADDGKESEWLLLGETISGRLLLNTTELFDGAYLFRAVANDGATTTMSLTRKMLIDNKLPLIRFIDGKRTVVSENSATVRGSVFAPDIAGVRPTITQVAYSKDRGESWVTLPAMDGTYNAFEERFVATFSFTEPSEGNHEIRWRATDSRGFDVIARHTVVIDTVAPKAPTIIFPSNNALVSNALDEDRKKAGLQMTIFGRGEPKSQVTLTLAGRSYHTEASFDDGSFRQAVEIPSRGEYVIVAAAKDAAGNESVKTKTVITYNTPPQVVFVSPREGRGVHGIFDVEWLLKDPDGDAPKYLSLSYGKGKSEKSTHMLVKNPTKNSFSWNTTKLETGSDYMLAIEVYDGFATTSKTIAIAIDNTAPTLDALLIPQRAFLEEGTFLASGTATDDLSGVEYVEYTMIKEGEEISTKDWQKGVITEGTLTRKAVFTIKIPLKVSDGAYRFLARAVDASGNISLKKEETIIVDSTPPRFASLSLFYKNAPIPLKDGRFIIPTNVPVALALSLEDDTKEAGVVLSDGETYALKHDIVTDLWKTEFALSKIDTIRISLTTVDKSGNRGLLDSIATAYVVSPGKVIYRENSDSFPVKEKTVAVQVFDQNRNDYSSWSGETSAYGDLVNGTEGEYILALPRGTYRFVVSSPGFEQLTTKPITLDEAQFITENLAISKKRSFWGIIKAWFGKKFNRN